MHFLRGIKGTLKITHESMTRFMIDLNDAIKMGRIEDTIGGEIC